jgi:hypothetical protein
MSEVPDASRAETVDADVLEYRAVSGLAVASLLAGLISLVAILAPIFWIVPLLSIFTSFIALFRINAAGPTVLGRRAALLGLALSIVSLTAIVTEMVSARWWLAYDAQRVSQEWLDALGRGKRHEAHELCLIPELRLQPNSAQAKADFKRFMSDPLVRTLLALGKRFDARYYETEQLTRDDEQDMDVVTLVYAVTFAEAGKKKSFFVRFRLERTVERFTRRCQWRIAAVDGGIHPATPPQ